LENSAILSLTSISVTPSEPRRQQPSWCEDNSNNWTAKKLVSELDLRGFKVPSSMCNNKKFLHQMYNANRGQTVPAMTPPGEHQEPVVYADVSEDTDPVHIPAERQRYYAISRGQVPLTTTAGKIRSTAAVGRPPPQATVANTTCMPFMDQMLLDQHKFCTNALSKLEYDP
jgi:hypothetical protein